MFEHHEIRALLPHAHPMVLVDRIIKLTPGEACTAVKVISATEACYGELAENDTTTDTSYPISLAIESFGQAAALLWLATYRDSADPAALPMFCAAKDVQVHRTVHPGDVLRHEVEMVHMNQGSAFARGVTYCGAAPVLTFTSMAAVVRPADRIATEEETRPREGTLT